MSEKPATVEVFCSYAHEDKTWLQKLEKHLKPLQRQELISLWYDRLIMAGADWTRAIDTHLETASVILLLVSANFLASDHCYNIEMKRALERQETGEARVIPILISPADWKNAPLAHLQVLPTGAEPITSWPREDDALTDVAQGIRRAVEQIVLRPKV
jgi:TIR domain